MKKHNWGGVKDDYYKIIIKAIDRSLDIYLKAAKGENSEPLENDRLMKIGELAKEVGESNSTIRHWTKEGILTIEDVTESGYQLYSYEIIERVRKIQSLKKKRLTLKEIKEKLN